MRLFPRSAILGALTLTIGCGATVPFHPATPAEVAAGSPLGASYILVPLPHDDDALLGRVLLDVPESGLSLDEVSRTTECADKLTPKKEIPLASTFEDAQELSTGGKARAALGAFGFDGDAQTATHFYYQLDVSRRVSQIATTDYTACCKDKGSCGYGFVSALIYGDGQYATAAQNSAEGNITIPVAGGAGGFVKARILHKRSVHGYVAAMVTVTDPKANRPISVLGDPSAAGIALTEQNLPEEMKKRVDLEKIQVVAQGSGPVEVAYVFEDGHGEMTENEFVRRYRALTKSHELDGAELQRRKGLLYGGSLVALGSMTVEIGVLTANDCVSGCGKGTGVAMAFVGGGILVGLGLATGAALASDGSASDHSLTKADAERYVARYNRALLSNTIQETKERKLSGKNEPPGFKILPMVSPEFTGIVGTF